MTVAQRYAVEISEGRLKQDARQADIIRRLDDLQMRLVQAIPRSHGIVARMFGTRRTAPVRGMYIHGEVGRGKTRLMDLFFAEVRGSPKRRIHFHAFMQEVHARRAADRSDDVIARIATAIASEARLLCLDEMQIADIADAMIIGRLFEALLAHGVCVVTTSNLPPEGLYKDGLNRQLFLPFIAKLRENLDVVSLDSHVDYRLGRIKSHDTFITPLGPVSTARLDQLWWDLTDGAEGDAVDIDVLGRKLHVPRAAHGCARFTFAELCGNPLGPPDFLAISRNFRTVFVDGIPVLKPVRRNEAKRLVLMIDTFYDAGTRLAATAAAEPESLHPAGKHGFEFQRTVSRLREMQSASWWGKSIPET